MNSRELPACFSRRMLLDELPCLFLFAFEHEYEATVSAPRAPCVGEQSLHFLVGFRSSYSSLLGTRGRTAAGAEAAEVSCGSWHEHS